MEGIELYSHEIIRTFGKNTNCKEYKKWIWNNLAKMFKIAQQVENYEKLKSGTISWKPKPDSDKNSKKSHLERLTTISFCNEATD